jgi:hypothetical protein
MSDRKYRHKGYRDDDRERERPPAPPKDERPREMRAPNFMGFVESMRCARCGRAYQGQQPADATCAGCGVGLHACIQCASFDPGSPLECMQPIKVRVAPKDAVNTCTLFEPRVRIEKQTGSVAQSSARSAFDDLFKF